MHWSGVGCNAKFLQISSDEEPNSSTAWAAWARKYIYFLANFHFWVNYSFKLYIYIFKLSQFNNATPLILMQYKVVK